MIKRCCTFYKFSQKHSRLFAKTVLSTYKINKLNTCPIMTKFAYKFKWNI